MTGRPTRCVERVPLCGGELGSEPHETDGARLTARLPEDSKESST